MHWFRALGVKVPQPPDDTHGGDALIGDLLQQVSDALDEAELKDGAVRQALLDGVRDAFTSISGDGPTVTVVDGGRMADTPPTSGERPELRIATPAEDDEPESEPPVTTRVRVLRGPRSRPVRLVGRIAVAPQGTDGDQQTIFRGEQARPYRLICDRGTLQVELDGMPSERLGAGQSLDAEARMIRVVGAADEPSQGRYARLLSADVPQ